MAVFRVIIPFVDKELSREGSWEEVRRWGGKLHGIARWLPERRSWLILPYSIFAYPSLVREGLKEIFGEDADSLIDEAVRYANESFSDKVLITYPLGRIDDKYVYFLIKKLKEEGLCSDRENYCVVGVGDLVRSGINVVGARRLESLIDKLVRGKYLPRDKDAVSVRLYLKDMNPKPKVVIERSTDKAGWWVVKPAEGTSWWEFHDVMADFVNKMYSVPYKVRIIDERGRPTFTVRSMRFAAWFRSDPSSKFRDSVVFAGFLLPEVIDLFRRNGYDVVIKDSDVKEVLRVSEKAVKEGLSRSGGVGLREYQEKVINEWLREGGKGTVVLPTGTGKTFVALEAIKRLGVPTLIVVPTNALAEQWVKRLRELGVTDVGRWYGGYKDVRDVTVTTYKSLPELGRLHGNRFALIISDEAHHQSARSYLQGLSFFVAPLRLGLTATPERGDENEELIYRFVGKPIKGLEPVEYIKSRYLAPFTVEMVKVSLSPEELERVNDLVGRSYEVSGRKAAVLKSKASRVVEQAKSKVQKAVELIKEHLSRGDKVIVFTNYREQAKDLLKMVRESLGDVAVVLMGGMKDEDIRKVLSAFREGRKKVLIVTQAGDEGIDVPDANVGIFLSYYSQPRQVIQRLGRLLRYREGKVGKIYIVYADHPFDRRRAQDIYSLIDRTFRLEEIKEFIKEMKREAEKVVRRHGRRAIESVMQALKEGRLPKELSERLVAISGKKVGDLTDEDKYVLAYALMLVRGSRSALSDASRESKHVPRRVYTWLKHPNRYDIPGVDAVAKDLMKKVRRKVRRKNKVGVSK